MLLQLIKFGVVGIVAAIVDVGVLVALKELLHADVLIASAMSFVFKGKKQSKLKEFIIFVVLSVGGLCLNQLILWIGVKFTSVYYLIVKLFAMVIVPVYNFVTRKIFLESKEK